MTITGVAGPATTATSTSTESQIARLRKQEQELTKQLGDLASSGDDADAVEAKQQLLTAQIQAIELQIARLEAQQAQASQAKAQEAATDAGAAPRSIDGTGVVVDVEL